MGLLKESKKFFLIFYSLLPLICLAQNDVNNEYERSSMHVMMIKHPNQKFDDVVEKCFLLIPFPERFNNHDLGVKTVFFAEGDGDQTNNIESFISQVNIGQKMVAKWFNRDKGTGSFNMNLIRERGCYNATQNAINKARASLRGLSLLEDAGENLIGNTYLIVSNINYQSKRSGNWALKSLITTNVEKMEKIISSIGGFQAVVTSYLFRLKWTDDISNTFYNNYYTEDGTKDSLKVKAFKNEKNLFQMDFVGKAESVTSEVNSKLSKDPAKFLVKVLTRTLDENIAKIQHNYADFRIKAPLIKTNPTIQAQVGLKEDITEESRFEVLERVIDVKGNMSYKAVGIIKPKVGMIWDNRYMAYDDKEINSDLKFTTFERVSGGDFFPGMLIREIK